MDITELTVHELQEKIKNKELTITEITKAYVDRMNEKEKDVQAFITELKDEALKQSEEIQNKIDNGEKLGDLAGIPIGIKDIICTKGVKTTCASKMLENFVYICVDYIDSTDVEGKVAYKFTGYATDNNLLIDYNLNYDGTVALAIANNYSETNNSTFYIGKDGVVRQKVSITRDMFVANELDEVLIAKQNSWLDKVAVANNVTMTTFGLPFEITVGTIFKCGIYITDTLHHTSGNCFVTKVTDKISNNMFTTEFNMIRLPGKNNDINENL